jgi:NNP family nitrate/nitrite transporter-like MFS transporter
MPAVFNSLVESHGLSARVSWRVAYIVPFILITATAIGMLLLCEDTPTGAWASRAADIQALQKSQSTSDPTLTAEEEVIRGVDVKKSESDIGSIGSDSRTSDPTRQEVVIKPSLRSTFKVLLSIHSLALAVPYALSFGTVPLALPSHATST